MAGRMRSVFVRCRAFSREDFAWLL